MSMEAGGGGVRWLDAQLRLEHWRAMRGDEQVAGYSAQRGSVYTCRENQAQNLTPATRYVA
jgi:hypothetical protein